MELISEQDLHERLKAFVQSKGSAKAASSELNVSEQYLSDVLRGRRPIGPSVGEELGYSLTRMWCPLLPNQFKTLLKDNP